jgi:hypothetical protein
MYITLFKFCYVQRCSSLTSFYTWNTTVDIKRFLSNDTDIDACISMRIHMIWSATKLTISAHTMTIIFTVEISGRTWSGLRDWSDRLTSLKEDVIKGHVTLSGLMSAKTTWPVDQTLCTEEFKLFKQCSSRLIESTKRIYLMIFPLVRISWMTRTPMALWWLLRYKRWIEIYSSRTAFHGFMARLQVWTLWAPNILDFFWYF